MHGAFTKDRLEVLEADDGAFAFLAEKLPVVDLTAAAIDGQIPAAVVRRPREGADSLSRDDPYDAIARVLYRRSRRHLLLTGLKGVGKTSVVRELARRAAAGEIPFLADRRFVWIDCKNVGSEDSRGCLETILAIADRQAPLVLCLDGLDALIKRPGGGTCADRILSLLSKVPCPPSNVIIRMNTCFKASHRLKSRTVLGKASVFLRRWRFDGIRQLMPAHTCLGLIR